MSISILRAREIGLLRALGLTSKDIFGMLFIEILILATISIVVGTIIGASIAYYYELHPIVISGIAETYKEYGLVSDEIPMNFDLFTITWNALTIFILNLAAITLSDNQDQQTYSNGGNEICIR